jgi:8-oxo-dGTP pyrophosphatase MutT (NUDIX family)
MNDYPKWKRFERRTLHKGRTTIVEYDIELSNGQEEVYEVDESTTAGTAVLMKTEDNKIVLTHQYRFPLDQWIYDLPGGTQEIGETTEQAACRECQEEVGLSPINIKKLITYYPNPGRASYPIHLYYCDSFKESKMQEPDPNEPVEAKYISIKELDELIRANEIIDPSLLIAWHTAKQKGYISI